MKDNVKSFRTDVKVEAQKKAATSKTKDIVTWWRGATSERDGFEAAGLDSTKV
jgi:hypothetical protein